MSEHEVPTRPSPIREGRRDRRRHRRQLSGGPPRPPRLDRHGADRQGAASEPRGLHGPRLELHLPGRSQQGDGPARRAERQPVPRRRAHRVDSGGIEVARTQERMDEFDRRMTSAKAWGVEAELLTPAQVKELVPFISEDVILGGFHCPSVSVVDSLDTGTLFRNEAVEKSRPPGVREHRGARRRDRRRAGDRLAEGHRRRHRQGPHRGRVRRDRLWRVVEPHRQHGRRHDPARPGGAPDGRRRPDRRARRDAERDQLPDRPRHGHVLLRAPVVGFDGGGLLRPPPDPAPPR